jgi:hypothetical protein
MWEVPKYRISAYLRSVQTQRKREKDRVDRETMHLQRVRVELRMFEGLGAPPTLISGRALLNDLTARQLKLFTSEPLETGATLSLTICTRQPFFVNARVAFCHEAPFTTRVLTETPLRYRVGIVFQFRTANEAAAVEEFVSLLQNQHLKLPAIGA